ncbi:MAG TPA: MBL fold metallo-hydrolase [Solirubrobacteraceae bacterium]|jgi:glyoxylase-like metal-dependent hydrolase (beta-lactamase superfamily II)|nr:MBL fold metallo-hydrolase [Solirubrobacteraceae bacterium]
MQALSVHGDVVVVRSEMWQTTCTVVHRGDETFVIDSPVFQDELDALPAILGQAGWSPSGLLCTHGDWDHVLARLVFPDASLGVAETTAARLRAEPGDAQRSLREFDDENYVERPRPLSLGSVQALPVPGSVEIGDERLELLPADGHTQDGMAIWIPWARVLVCGDYLLPVEIPWLQEHGSRSAYLATLARLAPYVERADWVVPGHGAPLDAARAQAIMREDVAYLEGLPSQDAPLPLARRSPRQRRLHADNVAKVLRGQG